MAAGRTDGRLTAEPTHAVLPIPVIPASRTYLVVKRLMDFVGAALALVLTFPLMVLSAIAIKLESPGSVFFSHTRLGAGGRPFRFYKFRSMCEEAASLQAALQGMNEISGPVFKIRRDPRVTAIGRIVRKTSIDELPQLWHVLAGHMSLVGPRPPVPEEVADYEPWMLARLSAKPGLTCTWQVSGRSDIPFDDWVRLDIEYVHNRSLWLDLKILARTIPAVITGRGAY
jgi:lipopolysaccharide/colanic/teichoic acid biosynthesis glycosyltransferase